MWAACVERGAHWVTSGTRAVESISSQITNVCLSVFGFARHFSWHKTPSQFAPRGGFPGRQSNQIDCKCLDLSVRTFAFTLFWLTNSRKVLQLSLHNKKYTYVSHTSPRKGLWNVVQMQETMYVRPIHMHTNSSMYTYSMIMIVQGIRLLKGHEDTCCVSHLNMMSVYQHEWNSTPVLLLDGFPPLSLRGNTVILRCFVLGLFFCGWGGLQWLASRYRWRIVLPVVAPIPGCVSFTHLSQEPASC